jgi:hypothetical protein
MREHSIPCHLFIYLFMVCIMTLLVVQTVLHQMAGPQVNSELEGALKEAVMALF